MAAVLRVLTVLFTAVVTPSASRAADALPILAGRWSSVDCARFDPTETRWFAPNSVSSFNDQCRLTAERSAGRLYRAHLTCRYRAAHDGADDVVLEVGSPTALRWVDQCSSTVYRFCGRGKAPSPLGPAPR